MVSGHYIYIYFTIDLCPFLYFLLLCLSVIPGKFRPGQHTLSIYIKLHNLFNLVSGREHYSVVRRALSHRIGVVPRCERGWRVLPP